MRTKNAQAPGTGKELSKVLRYLRDGYCLKITLGSSKVAMIVTSHDENPVAMASYEVVDFLKEAGILELVHDSWTTEVFRLSQTFSITK